MDLLFNLVVLGQLLLITVSVYWFFKRNDELPLVVSGLTFVFSCYRFFAVSQGYAQWVETAYTFGLDYITDSDAFQALLYISLSELVLILTYFALMKEKLPLHDPKIINPKLLPKPTNILALAFVVFFVSEQCKALIMDGSQNNYVFLFPLTQIGMSILLAAIWVFGGFQTQVQKIVCSVFFACAAYATFGIVLRFQFFGLFIAVATTFTAFQIPRKRMTAMAGTLLVGIFLFGASGALRSSNDTFDKVAGLSNTTGAMDRLLAAEDANMLDGFVILQQVYPNMLEHTWGGEHFEILTRPIPRAIWPDKPVGGFVNKLGMRDTEKDGNLGISPSIYGSFYGEGGLIGLIFFAIIYGFGMAKAMTWLARSHPMVNLMGRAVFISWLFPLLRGGDIPGIYSWLGMSMLPILVFCYLKRNLLFNRFQRGKSTPKPVQTERADLLPDTTVS
jgi:hypothetical protein